MVEVACGEPRHSGVREKERIRSGPGVRTVWRGPTVSRDPWDLLPGLRVTIQLRAMVVLSQYCLDLL